MSRRKKKLKWIAVEILCNLVHTQSSVFIIIFSTWSLHDFFFLRQLPICVGAHTVSGIVIKPGLEVDPAKKSGPGFYGSN